jgi:hypothetical protein
MHPFVDLCRLATTVAVSVLALGISPEPPRDRRDSRALLERARKAAGGDAWERVRTLHSVLKVEAGGLKGRADSWEDLTGRRYAERYDLGPATGASGFDGRAPWEQDSSGQVVPGESADARHAAANEAYRRSRAYWFPSRGEAALESAGEKSEGGRRFHVLRITPDGGRPFDLWIDAETFLFDSAPISA